MKAEKQSAKSSLIRAFRLKKYFQSMKEAISEEAYNDAQLITEHMRNRYFTMWRI
jgi:hypothetical protein